MAHLAQLFPSPQRERRQCGEIQNPTKGRSPYLTRASFLILRSVVAKDSLPVPYTPAVIREL
jgi:hypothetical protein